MQERFINIPLQPPNFEAISLQDRITQIPRAQQAINSLENVLQAGGSFYLESEDDYTLINEQVIQAMKGALFGMLTEVRIDAPASPKKEHVLHQR